MLNDFINLTQGQLLIKYWPLWMAIILAAVVSVYLDKRKYWDKRKEVEKRMSRVEYKDTRASDLYLRPLASGNVRVVTAAGKDKYRPIRASEYIR